MLIDDPAIFGLAWPLFGIAAAISTLLASRLFAAWERRKLWAVSQLVMAAGVLLPVIWSGMGAIIIAEIGRASCRESVCHYLSVSGVAVSLKKKKKQEYKNIY